MGSYIRDKTEILENACFSAILAYEGVLIHPQSATR